MDKAEYRIKLEQINSLAEAGDFEGAASVADTIDWRHVKSVRTLCMIGEIYEANRRYEDSKRMLLYAYKRSSISKTVLYRLAEISIRMGSYDEAKRFYNEFEQLSPHDNSRFILKYKLLRAEGVPLDDQISVLKEYKEREYTERWAYELARLYMKNGQTQKCIDECDEMILWFADGKYVTRAMELKMQLIALTTDQKVRYDARDAAIQREKAEEELQEESMTAEELVSKAADRAVEEDDRQENEKKKISTADIIKKMEAAAAGVVAEQVESIGADEAEEPAEEEADEDIAVTAEDVEEVIQAMIEEATREAAEEFAKRSAAGGEQMQQDAEEEETEASDEDETPEDSGAADTAQADEAEEAGDEAAAEEAAEADTEQAAEETVEASDEDETPEDSGASDTAPAEEAEEAGDEPAAEEEAEADTDQAAEETVEASDEDETPEDSGASDAAPAEEAEEAGDEPAAEEEAEADADQAARETAEAADEDETPEDSEEDEAEDESEEAAPTPEEIAKNADEEAERALQEMMASFLDEFANSGDEYRLTSEVIPEEEEVAFRKEARQKDRERMLGKETDESLGLTRTESFQEQLKKALEEGGNYEEANQIIVDSDKFESPEEAARRTVMAANGGVYVSPEEEDDEYGSEAEEDTQQPADEENAEQSGVDSSASGEDEADEEDRTGQEPDDNTSESEPDEESETGSEDASEDAEEGENDVDIVEKILAEPDIMERVEIMPRKLSEEERELFSYFANIPGISEQVSLALADIHNNAGDKTSRSGNVLIMGRQLSGKTRLADGLIRAACLDLHIKAVKLAKVIGEDLNGRDAAEVVDRMSGGFLLIEGAGSMSDEFVTDLNKAMEFRTDDLIVILEDEKADLVALLDKHPEFAEKFTSTIIVPVFTNDELVTFARTYANEQGYRIDEMGTLALYTMIGENQKDNEPMVVGKVKKMVDRAIEHAKGPKITSLFRRNASADTGKNWLREKDFR